MMNGIQFQSVQTPNALSSELRSVIRDNVLQFYVQGNGMDVQEEGITALYERLSQEDKLDGESNSIANQDGICQGDFLPKLSFYVKASFAIAILAKDVFSIFNMIVVNPFFG